MWNCDKEIMRLEFDNICLREWAQNDAEVLVKIANNKKVANHLRDAFPSPYGPEDAEAWIEMVVNFDGPTRFFAIEYYKELAGSFGAVPKDDIYRKTAEIGYFIGEEYWGKGIMSKVLPMVIPYLFKTFNLVRIYAEPFSNNLASRRVLEKSGFIHEATLKKNICKNDLILDSCIYAVTKD